MEKDMYPRDRKEYQTGNETRLVVVDCAAQSAVVWQARRDCCFGIARDEQGGGQEKMRIYSLGL
jgi:hypothetical protein